jgi:hypothetical protein
MTDIMIPSLGEWEDITETTFGPSDEQPHFMTDNELYGTGELGEEGGTWLVQTPNGITTFVATNRAAAERAVYAKSRAAGDSPQDWVIQVWQAQDDYPGDENTDLLVDAWTDRADPLAWAEELP